MYNSLKCSRLLELWNANNTPALEYCYQPYRFPMCLFSLYPFPQLTSAKSYKMHFLLSSFTFSIVLKFFHVVECIGSLFMCIAKWYPIVWIYHVLSIQSLVGLHVGYFYFLGLVNNAVIDTCIKSLCGHAFYLSWLYPKNETVDSCDKFTLDFWRNVQTIFQSGYLILYSQQICMKVLASPHPHQYLLFLHISVKDVYIYVSRNNIV